MKNSPCNRVASFLGSKVLAAPGLNLHVVMERIPPNVGFTVLTAADVNKIADLIDEVENLRRYVHGRT